MASELHNKVKEILQRIYPLCDIEEEKVIYVNNQILRIDLFVSHPFEVAVECQGRQHSEFVPHFHKSKSSFRDYQLRDRAKEAWCFDHCIPLIYVYEHEDVTEELIREKVEKAERELDKWHYGDV